MPRPRARRLLARTVSAAAMFLALHASSDAEVRLAGRDGAVDIAIIGSITPLDVARVRQFLGGARSMRRPPVIALDSPGGDAAAALDIGEAVRRSGGWTTLAGSRARCWSACALILAAGAHRFAADNAVGIHRLRQADQDGATDLPSRVAPSYWATGERIKTYLRRMGVSDEFFRTMMSTSPNGLRILALDEMMTWSLVDGTLEDATRALRALQ